MQHRLFLAIAAVALGGLGYKAIGDVNRAWSHAKDGERSSRRWKTSTEKHEGGEVYKYVKDNVVGLMQFDIYGKAKDYRTRQTRVASTFVAMTTHHVKGSQKYKVGDYYRDIISD